MQQSSGGNERRSRWQIEKEKIGTKRKKTERERKGRKQPLFAVTACLHFGLFRVRLRVGQECGGRLINTSNGKTA